jgi:predicted PurR-regulated permease PerM/methylmalonyl-CoA mutase cobalamin-binding subunit
VVALLLWWGRPILLPVAIAVLLSFLLSPVCDWLERHRVPRAMSVVAVVTGAFIMLGALGFAVFNGINQLGGNIDRIYGNVAVKIDRMPFGNGQGTIGKVQETIENVEERLEERAAETVSEDSDDENVATRPATEPAMPRAGSDGPLPGADLDGATSRVTTQPATRAARGDSAEVPVYVTPVPRELTPLERVGDFLGVIAGPLGAAGLVIIFTFFILFQRDDLRDRIITLAAGQQLNLATQALDDATTRISKYLLAQAIVNGTYGLAIGIGLELISLGIKGEHFPSVWLWALLCATLRFIPYLGPWVAAAFPIIVSIGWWPDYDVFLATAGYIIIIELLSNNVMEPMLYGSSTGMSPVAVIAAAVFWTFVWGPVGLLVATPLTTCLVVLGKYVPALRFFDILLGDEPVLPPHSRLYQRMLALDVEDAEDVARAYRKEHTLAETFDNVLLPALALAERDRHAGNLTPQRIDFIRETSREIVADLSSQSEPLPSDSVDLSEPPSPGTAPPASSARIVLVPSVDAADMTAAQMLKALLDRRGYEVLVVGEQELTSEKLESVFGQRADVAVISALPPRAVTRARYLVKRLRQAQVERGEAASPIALLVGLWTMRYDARGAADRISEGGTDIRVVTMLTDAVDEIRQRAEVATARRTSPPEPASPPMALASGPANISPAAR